MLKRWIVIGLLLVLVGVNVTVAQEATEQVISPTLTDQMASLEQITETLRGLTAKTPVDHQFPTRQETIDYLRSSYDREFPPAQFERLKQFYVALGLLPADIDLRGVYLKLLDSQVAGFYDPDTKTMNVIPMSGNDPGSTLSFAEQITYVHEFTHALQDQYFDLNKLESPAVEALPDRSLAVTSLVEGDATATMTLYTQEVEARNPLAALSMLVEGLQAGNLFLPPGIPSILVNELLFPYEDGMNFIIALYKSGGWDAINAAFENPPTTSEQILHPEKYIAGEGAQEVTLDDQSAALGDGWTNVWNTPVGEYYLRASLATEIDKRAGDAGGGGLGRRRPAHLPERRSARLGAAPALGHAQRPEEFEDAYAAFGDKRFGSSADANGCWHDADAALCRIIGDTTTQVASAPTIAQAMALNGS